MTPGLGRDDMTILTIISRTVASYFSTFLDEETSRAVEHALKKDPEARAKVESHRESASNSTATNDSDLCTPSAIRRKKILIVEDDELNMKLFHDLLEFHGYETLQIKDGREVIDLAKKHSPDLILMDIQLPKVSGLEVMRWIKEDEELKSIPVIAVTALAMKGDEERIRSGGCEAYISKPISVSNFLQTINSTAEASR
jgi:two-component system cell cycle response regulator DivK